MTLEVVDEGDEFRRRETMTNPGESGTAQKRHWEKTYSDNTSFFGEGPSAFSKVALDRFRNEGVRTVLELGCGQGRDTLLFAREGFEVTALDYSEEGLKGLATRAEEVGVSAHVETRSFDVRQMLPFPDGSFDACYSHMLLCMELSSDELTALVDEIHRILRLGGLALYSVRNTFDPNYRTGIHKSEAMYEIGGFVVHFFSDEKVRSLSDGYEILDIRRMREGSLPRELFAVTLRKTANLRSGDTPRGAAEETRKGERATVGSENLTPKNPGKT